MMERWSEEHVYSNNELKKYATELALSLQEFERELKEQQYGQEIELTKAKQQYMTRIDGVRNQAAMRIEALESALIETKLKYKRELDRAEMIRAEMESNLYNIHLNQDRLDASIEEKIYNLDQLDGILEPERKISLQK